MVLLLFGIGLELSLDHLRRLWRAVLLGGSLQVGLTVAVTVLLATLRGMALGHAFFLGFVLAVSSTAVVLRGLNARGELGAPHGQLALGILVFQDLCVVPMMLVIPFLAGDERRAARGPALAGHGACCAARRAGGRAFPGAVRAGPGGADAAAGPVRHDGVPDLRGDGLAGRARGHLPGAGRLPGRSGGRRQRVPPPGPGRRDPGARRVWPACSSSPSACCWIRRRVVGRGAAGGPVAGRDPAGQVRPGVPHRRGPAPAAARWRC